MQELFTKVNRELNNAENKYGISYKKDGATVKTLIDGMQKILNGTEYEPVIKTVANGCTGIMANAYYHIEQWR